MTYTREELRVPAKITRLFRGKEDHGIWTVVVHLESPTGGWGQGFGCLALKDEDETRVFVQEVCAIFGHSDPERLTGQECLALYCVSPWDSIEGIEAPDGKRFTVRGFRLRHYPNHAPTPTDSKRASLVHTIEWASRRVNEARAEPAALPHLIDWETEP